MARMPRALSLEDATAALNAAEARLQRWQDEAAGAERAAEALAADLAEAEARAGDELLDADEDDQEALARIAAAIEAKRAEQKVALQAVEAAAGRLPGVHREVLRARAAAMRTRATVLKQLAVTRQARTDQLLAELADFEKVPFGPLARADSMGLVAAGFTPRTFTQRLSDRAGWLLNEAAGYESVAGDGTDAQAAQWVAKTVPPLDDTEQAAAEPVGV